MIRKDVTLFLSMRDLADIERIAKLECRDIGNFVAWCALEYVRKANESRGNGSNAKEVK